METPTEEQARILDSDARVRLVLAAPGSGKTWLVGQAIRRELERAPQAGIAALSFTNVAGDEIRRAVGYELGHPHFVGTIDSFVYRYIIRPFAHLLPSKKRLPYFRLIPDSSRPQNWRSVPDGVQLDVQIGKTRGGASLRCHLFDALFVGEDEGKPVLVRRDTYSRRLVPLSGKATDAVRSAKKELWKTLGWVSHSDAAFLGAALLHHKRTSALVRKTLASRFQFFVVDELQDTGWFLGTAIREIVSIERIRALLVGDPDQAIYEFTGAHPELCHRFEEVDGVTPLPLRTSLRCAKVICRIAENLSQSKARVKAARDVEGEALLLTYANPEVDLEALREALEHGKGVGEVKFVSRWNEDVDRLNRKSHSILGNIGSPLFGHLHAAVVQFRLGRNDRAIAAAVSALAKALFNRESVDDDFLEEHGISPADWRVAAQRLLLLANEEVKDESVFEWAERLLPKVFVLAQYLTPRASCHSRRPHRAKTESKARAEYIPARDRCGGSRGIVATTVHAVKGETHDVTVLYCPPYAKEDLCPSTIWWSDDPGLAEEGRVAFVAATRPRGCFVLLVHVETAERLQVKRPEFAPLFRRLTVEQYIREMAPASVP